MIFCTHVYATEENYKIENETTSVDFLDVDLYTINFPQTYPNDYVFSKDCFEKVEKITEDENWITVKMVVKEECQEPKDGEK